MSRFTLLLLSAALAMTAVARADDPPAQPKGKPDAAAEEKPEADPFAVPEGNDAKVLQLYLRKLARTPPKEQTREGILDHLNKMDKATAEVMKREVETDVFLSAMQMRMEVISLLERFGDTGAEHKQAELLKNLKADERPEVQKVVARLELMNRINDLPESKPEERQQLVQDVAAKIQAVPEGDDQDLQSAVQAAVTTAEALESLDDPAEAVAANRLFAKYLSARHDDRLTSTIERLEGTARRFELPGNAIQVSGTTLQGDKFNITDWKGKVVLVDFWATWCGPCLAELPNVKQMYDAYHEKGFEVVGISLDENPETLGKFLEEEMIPWTTLIDENPEKMGWDNPIARYYGIGAIPTVILVDKQGKVVSMEARGPALAMNLEKLLGPPLEKKEAKETSDKEEKKPESK